MIPLIIAAAARVAPMLAARGAAAGASGGGGVARASSALAKMPMHAPDGGSGNEPRRHNFDAGQLSGGADVFSSSNFQQPV
jgi:hypothetical protein